MLFETTGEPRLNELTLSRRVESMPLLDINADGPLGDAFLVRGAVDFHDAVRVVRELPWGRPSRSGDPLSVLEDGRGTASDKHITIAALARELGNTELELVLGIYRLGGDEYEAVGSLLAGHRLQSLPESFVWLRWYGGDFDFSSTRGGPRTVTVLQQETVSLDKLPRYAELRHKDFMLRFLLASKRDGLPDLKGLLALRERCVDLVIEAEESHRRSETELAGQIRDAEEAMRQGAVDAAEHAAEEAARRERQLAEQDRERREQWQVEESERRSDLLARAKARAAAAKRAARTGEAVPEEADEPEEVEDTARRRSLRRAPTEREEVADVVSSDTRERKSTRRAPTERDEPAPVPEPSEPDASEESEGAPSSRRGRKVTRKPPTERESIAVEPEPQPEEPQPEEPQPEEPQPEEPQPEAPASEVSDSEDDAAPASSGGRKRTRKPPTQR